MIKIPHTCPRGRTDCLALANIISDDKTSFFCCGENNGETRTFEQDKYTLCFKGHLKDEMSHNDKRDLTDQASVIIQSLSVIENGNENDWSAWVDDDEDDQEKLVIPKTVDELEAFYKTHKIKITDNNGTITMERKR